MHIRHLPPKPIMLADDLIEGHVALYDLKYRIGKEMLGYVNHSTNFSKYSSSETDLIKVSVNYGVIGNITTIDIGFMERVIKDELGFKVHLRIKEKQYIEPLMEKYKSGTCLLTICSEIKNIVIDKNIIERWPIESLYFVNIPFSPILN